MWLPKGILWGSLTSIIFVAAASGCGGERHPTPQSGAMGVPVVGKDRPETDLIQQRLDTDLIQGGNGKSVAVADVLKELHALQPPPGVDASLLAQLKSCLARQLSTYSQSRRDPARGRVNFSPAWRAGLEPSVVLEPPTAQEGRVKDPSPTSSALRFVSEPPTGPANRVTDLTLLDNGDGTFTLTWTYKNVGDYNQDGIVSIQDITPLAEHFQETAEGEGDSWRGWMDGNDGGIINIQDVTPPSLAENFFVNVAGYAIFGANVIDGEYSEIGRVPFSEIVADPRGIFSYSFSEPTL